MTKQSLCIAGACALALFGCSSSSGHPAVAASAGCHRLGDTSQTTASLLTPDRVYAAEQSPMITPHRTPSARPGTDLYVRATPGMSGEYLERTLSCHAAYGRAVNPNDPFHPDSGEVTEVNVQSAGTGYVVRVSGDDRKTNDEIWRRARTLTSPGSASVEQVASSGAAERY